MQVARPKIDDQYREYVALRLRVHELLATNADEDSIDALDEKMMEMWDGLDAQQRISLHGIGADLSWVLDGGAPPPRDHRPEDVTRDDFDALKAAFAANDFHAILHGVRACGPVMDVAQAAAVRAICFSSLGFPALSRVFVAFGTECAVKEAARRGFSPEAVSRLRSESVVHTLEDIEYAAENRVKTRLTSVTSLPSWRPSLLGAC